MMRSLMNTLLGISLFFAGFAHAIGTPVMNGIDEGGGYWKKIDGQVLLFVENRVFEIPETELSKDFGRDQLKGEVAANLFLHLWDTYIQENAIEARSHYNMLSRTQYISGRGVTCSRSVQDSEIENLYVFMDSEHTLIPRREGSKFECLLKLQENGESVGQPFQEPRGRFTVTNGGGSTESLSMFSEADSIHNQNLIQQYFLQEQIQLIRRKATP